MGTTPSTNSILGLPRTVVQNKNKTSHWKRWNPHWENSKTSSRRRRGLSTTCKTTTLLSLSSCHHCQLQTYFITNSRNCDSRDLTFFVEKKVNETLLVVFEMPFSRCLSVSKEPFITTKNGSNPGTDVFGKPASSRTEAEPCH